MRQPSAEHGPAVPFRVSWHIVACAAHSEQRMPWTVKPPEMLTPHLHWVAWALAGITLTPRQCHIAVHFFATSELQSLLSCRVLSQADAALQETPSVHVRACHPWRRRQFANVSRRGSGGNDTYNHTLALLAGFRKLMSHVNRSCFMTIA
jgi:hypothetical protein